MEFLLYLSSQSKDIYNLISQKVKVRENTPICRQYDMFGYYDSATKTMSICTNRIKKYQYLEKNINETLLHESVHVAQSCKVGMKYLEEFGINSSLMPLSPNKEMDLNRIVQQDYRLKNIDREALWMEDKPDKVKYVVQKYCF